MSRARSLRIQAKRRINSMPLPTLTVNGTTLFSIMGMPEHPIANSKPRALLKKILYQTRTVAVDADGTVLLNIFKKRGATQTQLVTSFSLEGVTVDDDVNVPFDTAMTIVDKTLLGGDVFYGSIVNNSAAIDTNPAAFVQALSVEFDPLDVAGDTFFDNDGDVGPG